MISKSYKNKIVKVKTDSIVTLQQAKDQLHVSEDYFEDDSHILFLIEAATSLAEDYTNQDLITTTNTLEFIRFSGSTIRVDEAPYKAMTSVTTTIDDVETILDSSLYEIQVRNTEFIIHFTDTIIADKLTLVFTTGYSYDEAPYSVQAAVLTKIADLYDVERSSFSMGSSFKDNQTFYRLLNAHIINRW